MWKVLLLEGMSKDAKDLRLYVSAKRNPNNMKIILLFRNPRGMRSLEHGRGCGREVNMALAMGRR